MRNAEVRMYHMWAESLVGVSSNDLQRHALILSSEPVWPLLHTTTANRKPTIVARCFFWANPAKDETRKMACQEVGGTFLDIGALAKDEANYARAKRDFSHKGVAAHPGDTGMRAIADAILDAIANRQQRKDQQ